MGVVLAVVTLGLGGVGGARGEWDGDEIKVNVDSALESTRNVVVTISTLCGNEVAVSFSTGRSAPAGSRRTYRSSYDAQGGEASAGSDYRSDTGSLVVSKARPVTFTLQVTDDLVAEPIEHVRVLVQTGINSAAFAGNTWACSQVPDDQGDVYIESAFPIIDDDQATPKAAVGGGEGATSDPSATADAPSEPDPDPTPSRATDDVGTAPAVDQAGAAPTTGAARGSSSSALPVLVVLVLAGLVAATLVARRRRQS